MEENKRPLGWKFYLAELGILVLGAFGMWLFGSIVMNTATLNNIGKMTADRALGNGVMTVLGLAMVCFHLRMEYANGKLDYNNGEHLFRFLFCLCIGLAVAFVCGFLPVGGWPFLFVFVMLSLYSNMSTGILASSVLLLIPVFLSGGSVGHFALYLISGMFAVTLFRHLENGFRIGIPLFLSIFCLLVCETAGIILVANARPEFELFVIPAANMIVSSILLLGLLKLFSSMVVYEYREKYLEINDTENEVLAKLRQENRAEYMHCIHTAYFCERLGKQLGLDVDALKCAGYYHKLGDKLESFMEEKEFPPAVRKILTEYQNKKQGITERETAVLLCSDTVVGSIMYMLEKAADRQVDYAKVIDAVFKKLQEDGSFNKCNISVKELRVMQQIFKEEKLYYDFLH